MADRDRPLLGDISQEIAQLRAELGEMLGLRWQLARLEFDAALGAVKRLAVLLTVAAVMLITALPLGAVVAAEILDGVWAIPKTVWLAGFCLFLAVGAGLIGWTAWRRFRVGYAGFEETLEELHEDVVWIRELTEGRSAARQARDE
jgi:putative superfamily III holin-X